MPGMPFLFQAYIRHLFKAKEMLGMRLCVLHNLYFYNKMMEEIRDAIEQHRYAEYKGSEACRYGGRPAGIVIHISGF